MWCFDESCNNTAIVDEDGFSATYSYLQSMCDMLASNLNKRCLVFSLCTNTRGSFLGYVSFLSNRVVPLMIDASLDSEMLLRLIEIYRPDYLWLPDEMATYYSQYELKCSIWGYSLVKTRFDSFFLLHDDLALLVTTSGSTGSPKLVRQSYKNIFCNTKSICEYLEIDDTERAITTLPMQYVYGTSIINSHLMMGATVLLTTKGIAQKDFWTFFKENGATSVAGVPYTYEMLKNMRFTRMKLPTLRTMTQAGGKLLPQLHKEFAEYAFNNDIKFVIMYGAAEATARMGYLPPEISLEKYGSMGIAIPGGRFELVDDFGKVINESGKAGELVYYGDNVTLGYAERGEDLALGDERGGRLETGDIAMSDEDGYYTIVGRKKRFLKIFGNRIGLDETERMIKSKFLGAECACCGVDDRMYIFITDASLTEAIIEFLPRTTSLNLQAFRVKSIENIPKNEAGKIQYSKLEKYYD